jgi:hypothetical protein
LRARHQKNRSKYESVDVHILKRMQN